MSLKRLIFLASLVFVFALSMTLATYTNAWANCQNGPCNCSRVCPCTQQTVCDRALIDGICKYVCIPINPPYCWDC